MMRVLMHTFDWAFSSWVVYIAPFDAAAEVALTCGTPLYVQGILSYRQSSLHDCRRLPSSHQLYSILSRKVISFHNCQGKCGLCSIRIELISESWLEMCSTCHECILLHKDNNFRLFVCQDHLLISRIQNHQVRFMTQA